VKWNKPSSEGLYVTPKGGLKIVNNICDEFFTSQDGLLALLLKGGSGAPSLHEYCMYYQELTLIPTKEISSNHILSGVFRQIHLGLATVMEGKEKGNIGVSFPQYHNGLKSTCLGNKVRLFAPTKEELETLDINKWLRRFTDYVHVASIKEVPHEVDGYATYRRFHQPKNPASKARLFSKKYEGKLENASYEECLKRFSKFAHEPRSLPFVALNSISSNQTYYLNIAKEEKSGFEFYGYNSFGLDNKSSVPEF
jgi:CRISPR-associated endonuclease Csy4